ncbi:MAG: sigma-70 family RNA polymerase sigma factor [Verrucomicrobia bacterium]|nr:MAG: sigma-70 family RNA polymerase sigma factor [Verrucomicrobiota bacterium]
MKSAGSASDLWPAAASLAAGGRKPSSGEATGARAAADPEEERLVRLAQEGDQEAFGRLVERHAGRVYACLRLWVGQTQDAEDLCQETFLKAYRALPRFRRDCSFGAWLLVIARRTASNFFRGRRPTESLHEGHMEGAVTSGPDVEFGRADLHGSIWEVARRLKPAFFEVLWLHYHQDLGIEEMARVLRTTRVNVRVLLFRARRELARRLRRCAWAEELPWRERGDMAGAEAED